MGAAFVFGVQGIQAMFFAGNFVQQANRDELGKVAVDSGKVDMPIYGLGALIQRPHRKWLGALQDQAQQYVAWAR